MSQICANREAILSAAKVNPKRKSTKGPLDARVAQVHVHSDKCYMYNVQYSVLRSCSAFSQLEVRLVSWLEKMRTKVPLTRDRIWVEARRIWMELFPVPASAAAAAPPGPAPAAASSADGDAGTWEPTENWFRRFKRRYDVSYVTVTAHGEGGGVSEEPIQKELDAVAEKRISTQSRQLTLHESFRNQSKNVCAREKLEISNCFLSS